MERQALSGNPKFPIFRRDLSKAREAYYNNDVEASASAHNQSNPVEYNVADYHCMPDGHTEEHVNGSGEYLKAFVFGGLDGVLTIFAAVSACVAAGLPPFTVLIVGIGNVIADAISMGLGEYVSASTEQEFYNAEQSREIWEVENCPQQEKEEMVSIYVNKYGFTSEDAWSLIEIAFKYKSFFIDHMMVEELGLMKADSSITPLKRGLVMFASFIFFGLIPLFGFVLWVLAFGVSVDHSNRFSFGIAILFSILTLFGLGYLKSRFVNQGKFKSGIIMASSGFLAGSLAFVVSIAMKSIVNV